MAQSESSCVKLLEIGVSLPRGFVPQPFPPLTFFDLRWLLPLPPVQRLFFYSYHQDTTQFIDTTLPNIKESLSLTLQHFFPLAGTLTWPSQSTKPQICSSRNNSGVMLTVAESDLDFDSLVGNHPRDVKDFFPLAPQLISSNIQGDDQVPVMALQVTVFPNTGICIGISTLHVIADGRSTSHFMKSWATICKSSIGDDPSSSFLQSSLPCYNRNLIDHLSNMETTYLNDLATFNITQENFYKPNIPNVEVDKVRATFVLDQQDIKKMKKWVQDQFTSEPHPHLTTFVVVCAFVWVCLIKVLPRNQDMDGLETEHLSFNIDCRERLNPAMPTTYFGNCVLPCFVDMERNNVMGGNGISLAAEAIGNAIQRILSEGVLVGAENLFIKYRFLVTKKRCLSIAGSPKFGVYDTDFGWGRPKKVEVISIDTSTGAMSLTEGRDGEGGIEVGLVLNKLQMSTFSSLFTNALRGLS